VKIFLIYRARLNRISSSPVPEVEVSQLVGGRMQQAMPYGMAPVQRGYRGLRIAGRGLVP
jgi:hypothetical protein